VCRDRCASASAFLIAVLLPPAARVGGPVDRTNETVFADSATERAGARRWSLRLPARTRFPSRCACLAQHLLVSCLSSITAAKATSSNVELQVTDCFDGSHQVSFDAVPNGKYQVSAYLDSKQMTACPLPLTIVAGSTSATNCTVQGQGLEQATAGNEPPRAEWCTTRACCSNPAICAGVSAAFQIIARDTRQSVRSEGGDEFNVVLSKPGADEVTANCSASHSCEALSARARHTLRICRCMAL